MSRLALQDGYVDPDRLNVSYLGDTVTISLCGVTWSGSDDNLEQLIRAFTYLRAEAKARRAVVDAMIPKAAK